MDERREGSWILEAKSYPSLMTFQFRQCLLSWTKFQFMDICRYPGVDQRLAVHAVSFKIWNSIFNLDYVLMI